MNWFIFRIAYRYYQGIHSEKSISIMMFISGLGIFIGSFALALVASIMNGFEQMTHKKLQGIHAQVIMRSIHNQPLQSKKVTDLLTSEFPEVLHFAPTAFGQVIIQQEGTTDITNALLLRAVNPEQEGMVSTLGDKISDQNGKQISLSKALENNQVVIGKKLADAYHIIPGTSINLMYVSELKVKGKRISLDTQTVTVSGTFSTGIEEFDYGLILCSFSLFKQLFPDIGITQFNLTLHKDANERATVDALKKRFGTSLEIYSWKDLYPSLVAALRIEKYAMGAIIALIALVASMNIISLLFMQITQKRADIAIYQTLGMRVSTIMTIFLCMGVSICMLSSSLGLIAAWAVGTALQRYPFITLPDTYYVSHLPIEMSLDIFVAVFIIVIIMGTIASLLPITRIKRMQIAHILRFEG